MIRYSDIKTAITEKIREKYPGIPVYGLETTEGYKIPCFFVSINIYTTDGGFNSTQKTLYAEITKIQEKADEKESLDFLQSMENAFYPKLKVGDRFLNTSDFTLNFEGDHRNIPYVEFESVFYDKVEKEDQSEIMKEIILKEEI